MSRTRLKHQASRITGALAALTLLACAGRMPIGVEIVTRRPPPERVEVIATSPGTGYYWIKGHWSWDHGDYVWIAGRWERPPRAEYRRWIAAHGAWGRGGYYWVEGHWA